MLRSSVLLFVLTFAFITACSGPPASDDERAISSVTIDQGPTASMLVSETLDLAATVNATGQIDTTVSWSTSNPTVATVSTTGTVTPNTTGTVTITATSTQDATKSDTIIVTVLDPVQIDAVSVGHSFVVALDSNGRAWSWGNDNNGQLGNGEASMSLVPTRVVVADNVSFKQISAGSQHALALDTLNRVWSWGLGDSGQLGHGTSASVSAPALVSDLDGVPIALVAAGANHSIAVGTNGRIWAWGSNGSGRLGTGDTTVRYSPTLLSPPAMLSEPGGTFVVGVAAGTVHSLAVDSRGNVWGWGGSFTGQTGVGDSATPLKVQFDQAVSAVTVSAGGQHSLAIGADGNAWGWGYNNNGQVGACTSSHVVRSPIPVAVRTGTAFSAVSGGFSHSAALDDSGQAWAWGNGASGSLGIGVRASVCVPTAVVQEREITFRSISSGNGVTAAIDQDGALWSWGWGGENMLGTGSLEDALAPVRVQFR